MSDMRQKLLPVFLEEAGRKIRQLEDFLSASGDEGKSLEELASAFRAAHTLKGTAALVQAAAVCSLSARIEGLLEGHYELERYPTKIEYEAMQLAVDRLKQLIQAIASGLDEPAGLLAEAELALKLAVSMPGRRGLNDLLSPVETADPFAEDPGFDDLLDDDSPAMSSVPSADPFAEDPGFEEEPPHPLTPVVDPFAEDPTVEPVAVVSEEPDGENKDLFDPFADDPDIEPATEKIKSLSVENLRTEDEVVDLFADDPGLQVEPSSVPVPVEPKQESYAERMRKRLEKESVLGTAERLALTLSNQSDADIEQQKFTCCRFRVAGKDYHLPIANMIEVSDLPSIIRLPLAPTVVRGLINLRGKVLPVIDLAANAGGSYPFVAVRKLVVAESGGEQLAFLTDGIPDLSVEMSGEKVDVDSFIEQFRAGGS